MSIKRRNKVMPGIYSYEQMAAHLIEASQDKNSPEWQMLTKFAADNGMNLNEDDDEDRVKEQEEQHASIKELLNMIQDISKYDPSDSWKAQKDLLDSVTETLKNTYRFMDRDETTSADPVQQSIKDMMEENEPAAYESVNGFLDQIDAVDATKGEKILSDAGLKKSAAKWIEQFKKEPKKGEQRVSEDTIAKIFAARQLANAVRSKRGNIDAKMLTEAEIIAKAEQIKKSELFQKFLEEHPVDYKLATAYGHGGKMEMQYDAFIKSQPDCQDLDSRLYGRYQYKFDNKTYEDFPKKMHGPKNSLIVPHRMNAQCRLHA